VYMYGNGTFTKSGGIIYGSNASSTLKNTSTSGDSYGHAVYISDSQAKIRNSTAGSSVTLDSAVSGSAGGWESSSGLSLAEWLDGISANPVEGGSYTYTLNSNADIAPKPLSYNGKNVSITLEGGTAERTVSLTTTGILFTIGSGVTLTLGSNVTLQGLNNTASLVQVNSGGTLVMNTGSKISGNKNTTESFYGGGVNMLGGAAFTMNGGTISGNESASNGAGVYVASNSAFTMTSGTISNNTASEFGGGVSVYGEFTMNSGMISNNTASEFGGGVSVYGGKFTMTGGTISSNSAGGYYEGYGGGVDVDINGTFTMTGGTISGNSADYGGGVDMYRGTFTQSGGTVSGNSADTGGGVFVGSDGRFTKSYGTIYGSGASSTLKNTAYDNSNGHAVYVDSSPIKKRNSTAGSSVALDSAVSGSAGGWE
jgi:hypothetical protein